LKVFHFDVSRFAYICLRPSPPVFHVIDTKPFPVILIRCVSLKLYWGTAKCPQCFERRVSIPICIFYTEDGGSTFLRNSGNYLPDYTASHRTARITLIKSHLGLEGQQFRLPTDRPLKEPSLWAVGYQSRQNVKLDNSPGIRNQE
jgi:hypothetical protein